MGATAFRFSKLKNVFDQALGEAASGVLEIYNYLEPFPSSLILNAEEFTRMMYHSTGFEPVIIDLDYDLFIKEKSWYKRICRGLDFSIVVDLKISLIKVYLRYDIPYKGFRHINILFYPEIMRIHFESKYRDGACEFRFQQGYCLSTSEKLRNIYAALGRMRFYAWDFDGSSAIAELRSLR